MEITKKIKLEELDDDKGQILLQACQEGSNELKYHEHNNVTIKNEIMQSMRDDNLAQIFMYISPFERPELALVCKKWQKALASSWSNVRVLNYLSENDFDYHLMDPNRIRLLLKLCGRYLKELNINIYIDSKMILLIQKYCINVEKINLGFNDRRDINFDNVFSQMHNMKTLRLELFLTRSLPESLINSIKDIAGTLTELTLDNIYCRSLVLPELLTSVLCQLGVLKVLNLNECELNDQLIQSVGNIPSLIKFSCSNKFGNRQVNMQPIINLEKLESLSIKINCQIDDEFIKNLADKSNNLRELRILKPSLTDVSVNSLSKLKQLEIIDLDFLKPNNFITNYSVKCLSNLKFLKLSRCIHVTDYAFTKVLQNSPELEYLNVAHTNVTRDIVKQAAQLTQNRENNITLNLIVALENTNGVLDTPEYKSKYLKVENKLDDRTIYLEHVQ
ncbi:uncharacterized protein LOC122848150 [Aphidius gifuensis]|uniref:uncharacterized protein LOC122848150 n=1 Tax=Aphidius gifuensis TaxID=684658 RepID=UPI001CDB5451|nr:uncharacterized protein LOC122848150 [Aphidius gifuensis]